MAEKEPLSTEETEKVFSKKVADWVFQQSVGVVISLLALGLLQYQNYQLDHRIQYLEQRMEQMLNYERGVMKDALDKNTRALEDFKTIISAQQPRK